MILFLSKFVLCMNCIYTRTIESFLFSKYYSFMENKTYGIFRNFVLAKGILKHNQVILVTSTLCLGKPKS